MNMVDVDQLKKKLELKIPIAVLGTPSDETILTMIKAVRDKSLPPLQMKFFQDGGLVIETFKVEEIDIKNFRLFS